jgi:hypothetical protein
MTTTVKIEKSCDVRLDGVVKSLQAGARLNLPNDKAQRLINAGFAKEEPGFSHQEALEHIQKVQAELDQAGPWPEHFTEWLQDHHPAALQTIRATTRGIDTACLNQDATGLDKALDEYRAVWMQGLNLWRDREQQPPLMAA